MQLGMNGRDPENGVKKMNNGELQGSVLAPTWFNIYTANLTSKKIAYAHDLAIAFQEKPKAIEEMVLNEDLTALGEYFRRRKYL